MPPSLNKENVRRYHRAPSVTDYAEFPGRTHYTVGQDGWEEVADKALSWAVEQTTGSMRLNRTVGIFRTADEYGKVAFHLRGTWRLP